MQSCERSGCLHGFREKRRYPKTPIKGTQNSSSALKCKDFEFLRVSFSFHQLSQRLCSHFFFLLLCCAREVLPFKIFHTFQSFSCDILQRGTILPCLQAPLPTLPLQPLPSPPSPTPPPPRSVYRFPAGLATHTHNMPLLWDPDTFCLLLSGRGDSPPPSSPSPSSFLLAAPTPTDGGGDWLVGEWVRGTGGGGDV